MTRLPAASEGTKKMAKKKDQKGAKSIHIPAIRRSVVKLRLVGMSPLVTHNWSEKAKSEMRAKQQGKARRKKDPKDPDAEFDAARYRLEDGRDGFPAVGIRKAIIGAARYVDGLTLVETRGSVFVNLGQELVPIEAPAPAMREDMVRVGGRGPGTGTADLRYRPEYWPWQIPIEVMFMGLTPEQVVNLVKLAGVHVGIGEWRPEKDGQWGMFDVRTDAEEAAA